MLQCCRNRPNFGFGFVFCTETADLPVSVDFCFRSKLVLAVSFSTKTKVAFSARLETEWSFDYWLYCFRLLALNYFSKVEFELKQGAMQLGYVLKKLLYLECRRCMDLKTIFRRITRIWIQSYYLTLMESRAKLLDKCIQPTLAASLRKCWNTFILGIQYSLIWVQLLTLLNSGMLNH